MSCANVLILNKEFCKIVVTILGYINNCHYLYYVIKDERYEYQYRKIS